MSGSDLLPAPGSGSASARFPEYAIYLKELADGQAAGEISPMQRPVSLRQFTRLASSRSAQDLRRLLLPTNSAVPAIYVASPWGFAIGSEAVRQEVRQRLEGLGFEVHDPWSYCTEPPATKDAALALGMLNFSMVESSAAVLGILDGASVDEGVAAEMAYAYALGRVVWGLRTDVRKSGECPELEVNLQVATPVYASGGRILGSLGELDLLRVPEGTNRRVQNSR